MQGAIFASVGITCLQLPNIDQTHWIVRALVSSSMALGIISIIMATSLQRQVTFLNTPTSIRLWLSSGLTFWHQVERCDSSAMPSERITLPSDPPLRSSVSGMIASEAPHTFLRLALVLFLFGFGLYYLFSWLESVEGSATEWRNAFIFFVSVVGAACAQAAVLKLWRANDAKKVADQFDIPSLNSPQRSKRILELEAMLEELRRLQDADIRHASDKDENQASAGAREPSMSSDAGARPGPIKTYTV